MSSWWVVGCIRANTKNSSRFSWIFGGGVGGGMQAISSELISDQVVLFCYEWKVESGAIFSI